MPKTSTTGIGTSEFRFGEHDFGAIPEVEYSDLPRAEFTAKGVGMVKRYVQANGQCVSKLKADAFTEGQPAEERITHMLFLYPDGTAIRYNPLSSPESIQKCGMFHGISQKVGDSPSGIIGAILKELELPADAPVTDEIREEGLARAVNGMLTILTRFETSFWVEEAKGGSTTRPTDFAEAVYRFAQQTGQEPEWTAVDWKRHLDKLAAQDKETGSKNIETLRNAVPVKRHLMDIVDERRKAARAALDAQETNEKEVLAILAS